MNNSASIETAAKHFENGDLKSADSICCEILHHDNQNGGAYHLRGVIAYQIKDYPAAIVLLGNANKLIKNNFNIVFALAASYENTQQYSHAISLYQNLCAQNPKHTSTYTAKQQLALCLEKNGELKKAKIELLTLIKNNKKNSDILFSLIRIFINEKNEKKSNKYAIELFSLPLNKPSALNNLGLLFKDIQLISSKNNNNDAIKCFEKAISIDNNHVKSRLNLASMQQDAGNTHDAEKNYLYLINNRLLNNEALSMAHYNLALIYLSTGDYQKGWGHLLHRPKTFHDTPTVLEIKNKRLLILKEEGLGDELTFLRFLPLLKKLNCKIDYVTSPKLLPLLENNEYLNNVYISNPSINDYDYCISLMDLPYILKIDDIYSVNPLALPLKSDEKIDQKGIVNKILANKSPNKIGITWQAGTQNNTDIKFLNKSIPIKTFCHILDNYTGTIIILQRNPPPSDLKVLIHYFKNKPYVNIIDASILNDNLSLMLTVLNDINHYLCVSNTNTHLFGSLIAGKIDGNDNKKRCDVLIPYPGEWRWMNTGESSPWYPNFTVHRQLKDLSWDKVEHKLKSIICD